jgi:hypothetical protein
LNAIFWSVVLGLRMLLKNKHGLMIWRTRMRNLNQDKDRKQEKLPRDKEVKDDIESKPSRLAERKGQRPAFPFRRKPV